MTTALAPDTTPTTPQAPGRAGRIATFLPVVAIVAVGIVAFGALDRLEGDLGLVAALVVVWAVALAGLNIIQGLAGYPSLAQAAFYGIGAYTSSILLEHGWSMWPAALAGVGGALLLGLLLAGVFSRTRGQYFAIGTLFFGAVCHLVFTNAGDWTGGPNGMPVQLGVDFEQIPALLAGSLVAVLLAFHALGRSSLGGALLSVREDEDLAGHLGVPTARAKLLGVLMSAAFGGWGGVLLAQYNGVIAPSQFTFVQGFLMFVAIGIGGYGRLFTPLVGALVVVGLTQLLKLEPGISQMVLGVLFILVTLAMPGGIIGTVERLLARLVQPFRKGNAG